MIKRFLWLIKKDTVTAYRNYYFLIVVAVALLFALLIRFVVPEDTSVKATVFYSTNYSGELRTQLYETIGQSKDINQNIVSVASREEIIGKMKENTNSFGMFIKQGDIRPTIEFIFQGYENEQSRNTLIIAMKDSLSGKTAENLKIDTILLKENISRDMNIPMNKNILPLFLLMEPAMLGFVLIASLIFMEKEEGTIRAYVTTPGKIPEYLASKIAVMVLLGIISTLIGSLIVVGFNADYLSLLALVIVSGIFFSALALILASFFENISQSIIWLIVISIMLSLPIVSYFLPSFAPIYIKILPTYSMMFAIREAVFSTGNTGIITSTLITFTVLSIISYLLAIFAYNRSLLRD